MDVLNSVICRIIYTKSIKTQKQVVLKSINIFTHVFKKDKNIFDLILIVWVLYMLAHEPKTNTFSSFVFYRLQN